LGAFIITVYNILRLFQTGINSTKMSKSVAFVMSRPLSSDLFVPSATFVFYVTSMVTAALFTSLAMNWPCLALTWERLEREFTFRNRRVSRITLATRFKIVTAVVMMLALSEFVARSERNPPRLCRWLVRETASAVSQHESASACRFVGLHALIALFFHSGARVGCALGVRQRGGMRGVPRQRGHHRDLFPDAISAGKTLEISSLERST